jgi:hypothetical protein
MLKSLIRSGIAGSIIVSANMAIRPTQLKIASVTHGDLEIFSPMRLFAVGLFTVPHSNNEYISLSMIKIKEHPINLAFSVMHSFHG